jgi:hypothetical protein
MSPMPPPPPGMDGAPLLGSGFSVTTASVVSSRPAMEPAFCSLPGSVPRQRENATSFASTSITGARLTPLEALYAREIGRPLASR